jgi:hypothetical protein
MISRWLFVEARARDLALVRVAVGCFGVGWLAVVHRELIDLGRLDPARFEPVGVVGLAGVDPQSSRVIALWVVVVGLAGVAFVLGWWYRFSAPAFAFGLLWLTTYQNSWGKLLHTENLLVIHTLVLAASPSGGALAVGRHGDGETSPRYGWPLRVMALATVLSYTAAGITKLRHAGLDWLDAENLRNWVAYDLVRKEVFGDPYLPIAVPALEHVWLFAPAMVWTLLVELGALLALTGRRAATAWATGAWALHVGVLAVMAVAFPYQLLAVAYLPVILASRATAAGPIAKIDPRAPSRRDLGGQGRHCSSPSWSPR